MYKFHRKCGDRVTLLNQNLTAIRNFVEFNHGLILSAEPLTNEILFEVRIDRKVNVWNGSLEIGVTTLDPDALELPATATKLRSTAWILSGNSIVKDGLTILNSYGPELDSLQEGECIGVSRSSKGELMFYINGRCLGIAAKDLPERLFAVIDLYGQCVQVSIVHSNYLRTVMDPPYESTSPEACASTSTRLHRETHIQMPLICPPVSTSDNLRFHPRCGILVKLLNNNKSAERTRPLDDYNNGVVMTHRPLFDNEFFEIRIDKLVDKWSGSIEVGVTAHNPATIRFPSTMTNMDTGTIMMSGCKVLMNGQGACMEYGDINLDDLREGDTVGMLRKGTGKLHYFINGIDQGVATDKVPSQVWGVIDLYGMTVKVTIVDACEDRDSNVNETPRLGAPELPVDAPLEEPEEGEEGAVGGASPEPASPSYSESPAQPSTSSYDASGCAGALIDEDQLLFHTLRDSHVIIINDGRTAHRPNAFEVLNNGFVMTNRTLKTNELFQVRLDLVIPKWAGSIEIGITQHSSNDIQFPFRMRDATSGTWGIVGEDVIRDGIVIIPQYVRNLNRLEEGDTVGVMRKDLGIVHFFVNGVDQGPAAFNIPEHVFGIIDLDGRVAQATIVENYTPIPISSPESPISFGSNATVLPETCFHRVHGLNARLSRNRLTASRAAVYSEFNNAVLFSSRPLRECDMFEIRIDKMVDCWIGSLEIGVTAIRPDDLEGSGGLGMLAGTATDLSWDTYILSASAVMKDGECVRSGYPLDLDTLTVGSRVGVMWHADRSLHYYLDGMDMGKAWYVPHLNIYAVVDLYGQCTQVTILQNEERAFNYNGCNTDHGIANTTSLPTPTPPYWSFSEYHGDNTSLSKDYTVARRITPDPMGAIVFSSTHLVLNELYEIQILEHKYAYAGSFRMGVTGINVLNANINRNLPLCISWLHHFTAYIDGKYVKYSRPGPGRVKDYHSIVPSFEWLRPGDRVGLKKVSESTVQIYYNSELLDYAFENVPDKVYVVMEMYGTTTKIQTVSRGVNVLPGNQQTIPNDKPEAISGEGTSDGLEMEKLPEDIAPVMAESDETSDAVDECEAPLTPPESELPDDTAQRTPTSPRSPNEEDSKDSVTPEALEEGNASPDRPLTLQDEESPSSSNMAEAVSQRRPALPYTFHFMIGSNIRLCSSDTVAQRYRGFCDGVAVASQPLRRGQSFRFRVDKITDDWDGTVCIGALGMLPTEVPPWTALHFNIPCWVVTNDTLYAEGVYTMSEVGRKLDEITENSVLTLHFRLNSELTLQINGVCRGVIATIPRRYDDIYPTIDLYGKIVQVSILLHPHVILRGTSLDLPMIEENQEESFDDIEQDDGPDSHSYSDPDEDGNLSINPLSISVGLDPIEDYTTSSDEPDDDYLSREQILSFGPNTYSDPLDDEYNYRDDADESGNTADVSNAIDDTDNSNPLMQECIEVHEIVYEQYEPVPGPSSAPDGVDLPIEPIPGPSSAPDGVGLPIVLNVNDAKNSEIKSAIHQSLLLHEEIVASNELAVESRGLKQSQSTQLFTQLATDEVSDPPSHPTSEDPSSADSLINPLGLGSRILDDDSVSPDEIEDICDMNIRHNDRYPEATELNDSSHDNDGYDASDTNDDNFDNVFMDAMFLETSNLPDLNEDQSLSLDESTTTRRDDYWADGLTVENLHYLNGIICWDQRVTGARVEHRDWVFYSETNGNCEVMHLALKFWNQIVAPYSDMREVVTSGNVHCFCSECHPDADPIYAGWVRIERASAQHMAQATRMYWHVVRATVASALALQDAAERDARRPRDFRAEPSTSPACADTWIDEEGKPHQAVLALDVDINDHDPEDDLLLAYWIYLRSHATMMLEAEDIEDTVGDAVEDILEDPVEDILEDTVDDEEDGFEDDEAAENVDSTGDEAGALVEVPLTQDESVEETGEPAVAPSTESVEPDE